MGRAEDLFKRIRDGGEAEIDNLIRDRQSEELFLDFKRSADNGGGNKLHDTDRSNLARAISGFGNSEGGLIVWGVDCRDLPDTGDVASAKAPIEDPQRFKSRLEGAVSGCTVPPHSRIQHVAIESGTAGHGFVVTLIPKSSLAPHQTVKPLQYYIRAGSDFVPAPHGVLAGLFGRSPQPFVFHMWRVAPATVVTRSASAPGQSVIRRAPLTGARLSNIEASFPLLPCESRLLPAYPSTERDEQLLTRRLRRNASKVA